MPLPKILIVDDRAENITLVERLLSRLEAELVKAYSGQQALTLALENEFCLAIVDVQMPEMDGYELVSLLRGNQSTRSLPVIFVSAISADEYHYQRGYESGAVDFLSKPFTPDILISKVRIFIELYEQKQTLHNLISELNHANQQLAEFNEQLETVVQQRTIDLQNAYQMLARLDRTKGDFIAVAAHELRTPLTLIRGYAEMLKENLNDQPDMQMMVDGIIHGEGRLLDVVNSMLDVTRIEAQVLHLHSAKMNSRLVLEAVRRSFAEALATRKQSLQMDNLDSLPLIEGDSELLMKLFGHLVSNAIKFTPDGGRIVVQGEAIPTGASQKEAEAVQVVVTDTGIGIHPEDQELIFQKFYQTGPVALHSTNSTSFKGGGPGLGLAIARGIVQAHGGRIWVESKAYDEQALPGSSFFVVLPVRGAHISEDERMHSGSDER